MSRLVTVGCSHTVGEGLPDKPELGYIGEKYCTTSTYAWPVHLGKKLNLSVWNIARGGISNKHICKQILDEPLFENDVVVFMWTYFARTCFFDDNALSKRILVSETERSLMNPKKFFSPNGTTQNKKDILYSKKFYENYFSHYNSVYESYQNINFAKYYLDTIGIQNFHTTCEFLPYKGVDDNGKEQVIEAPAWNFVNLHKINLYPKQSIDGFHPGVDAHKQISEEIYSIIRAQAGKKQPTI